MIIVFHTLSTDMLLAKQASAIGATTLAADRREPEHLSAAIKAILIGNRGCTPSATRAIETTSPPVLTQRECEVLALLAGGCRMKEVGYRLGISYRTVTFHKYRAMRKMGVQSDADLMRFVFRQNILGNVAAAAVHRI
jgi:DNA-binding NarL/FixJ family response regulator